MMKKRLWLIGMMSSAALLVAQDIDVGVSPQKHTPAITALEIKDKSERNAFGLLFQAAPPLQMRARAEAFLTAFPQSAYRAQGYETAARACFDLKEYAQGLHYAEESLALLPENPLLLVVVANVEAELDQNRAAMAHADEAAGDLDTFGTPATIAERDWPKLQRQLKASASFSKGRALLQQALGMAAGAQRTTLLSAAVASLTQAQQLNSADPEITYVAGLAQLARGEALEAASNLAAAYSAGGELAPKALEYLRTIFRSLPAGSSAGFEDFLQQANARALSARALVLKTAEIRADHATSGYSRTYLGSAGCAECHADIYSKWSQSGMGTMLRPYTPQTVAGDFTTSNVFYLSQDETGAGERKQGGGASPAPFARMVINDGRHYFEIRQAGGGWKRYPVNYLIGSKFQQAYATTLSNGEIHVFPIQYNLKQKRWINFWRVIDGPETERSDPANWEKLDSASSYQLNCAVCHTSQLRNVKGQGFDSNHLEFKEPGVGCEMCHGPAAQHAVDMAQNRFSTKAPLDPPVNFSQLGNRDFVAICAQCHMQSAMRKAGIGGELNYSSSGEFFARYTRSPLGDFSRKGFYKDGRLRQTTFIVEALERTKCFRTGQVSCGNCHDPHGHDSLSNPASVKFRDNPDRMCTGCHTQLLDGGRAAQHSHHLFQSEGSRCVSCHMPRIMDSLMFRARTHQIDDIPDAQATQRFGQEESPNACLLCHGERSAQWVEERLKVWKGTNAGDVERRRQSQ